MTDEHIKILVNLITTLTVVITGGVVLINATNRLFEFLKKRVAEKSVGATAIVALFEADKQIREDFNQLKKDHEELTDDIHKVQMDYNIIISKTLDFLSTKK